MVSLIDLPAEILTEIAAQLQPQSERLQFRPWSTSVDHRNIPINLLSLCHTCRLLRDIVQPILFRSIHAFFQSDDENTTSWHLSQTLTHRPYLAKHVKSLRLINTEPLNEESESDWSLKFPKIALHMIGLLHNATTLHLHTDTSFLARDQTRICERILLSHGSTTTGEAPLLPRLRALYISPEDGNEDFVRIVDFTSLFTHPELRKISIYSGVMLDGHDVWGIKKQDRLVPKTINISKLNLLGCLMDQGSLRRLVQACRDLKSLKYSQMDNDVYDLDACLRQDDGDHACKEALLTPSTFITAIGACKNTLENLEIDLKGPYGEFQDSSHKFDGLHEFTRLQSLNIEVRHLRTFQDLPPSLEHLKLRFWLWSSSQPEFSQPDFPGFLPSPDRSRWPQMKTVCLEGGYDKSRWEKDERMKQLIGIGTWVHESGTGPCCSVWRAGNVGFSLTNTALHRVLSGPRQWNILDDEVEE